MSLKLFFSLLLFLIIFNLTASHDKYRLTLRNNPATSITIGWNQVSGSDARVYYDNVDYGTDYQSYRFTKTPDRSVSYKGMNNRFVRLTDLRPDTAYYFVIVDDNQVSKRFWFKTATDDTSKLSFIAGGDSRNNRTPRRNANLLVSKLKPNAVLFGGDMTDDDTDMQWKTWFDDWQLTIAPDGRMFPVIATRGNHEESNNSIYYLFDTPSANIYYAITFGNNLVRTYTLNSEISILGNQTDWLRQDLTNNQNTTWRIAQYHKPMRPHVYYKREGNNQYNSWSTLFYEKNVQLVVECDAHTVKSTWPIKPSTSYGSDEGFIRDDEKGTVYVGEGCWGAPLRGANDTKKWTRDSGSFNQFKWIFVDKEKIETRTVKTDNANDVSEVDNSNRFATPSGLDVWSPSNGNIITIFNKKTTNPEPDIRTVIVPINNGKNDVEEDKNGKLYVTSTDLEMVYDRSNNLSFQKVGLRFENVQIPQNATIESAYLQFTADESNHQYTFLEIAMESTSNASLFTNAYNVSVRKLLTTKIAWIPSSWISGQNSASQKSPDLKTLVQQIVSKSKWNPGNNMAFIISGTGVSLTSKTAKRVANSFDGDPSKAARLFIQYKINNALDDVCSTISNWSSTLNYNLGDQVVYNNELYEKTHNSWMKVADCAGHNTNIENTKASVFGNQNNVMKPPFLNSEFSVSPIPFKNEIKISGNFDREGSDLRIQLQSLEGAIRIDQLIKNKNNNQLTIKVNPMLLPNGFYFLRLVDKNGLVKYMTKVFKQ